jgi:hypothetical protein
MFSRLSLPLLVCQQLRNPVTTNFLVFLVSIIPWSELCPVPTCTMIFLTITLWFSVISTSCSLHLVMAVLGQLLWADQWCLCSHLLIVSPGVPHCSHPSRNFCRHDEVNQRCLQQNCSPSQRIKSQYTGETVHHLLPFYRSELWISIGAHVLNMYFRLQKTDIASLVLSIKRT